MILWFDVQLSPQISLWTQETFGIQARHLDKIGYRTAKDRAIFLAAKAEGSIVIVSKDADYVDLLARFGPPPSVIWLTCGNTSNAALRALLRERLPAAVVLIESGEPLVELA